MEVGFEFKIFLVLTYSIACCLGYPFLPLSILVMLLQFFGSRYTLSVQVTHDSDGKGLSLYSFLQTYLLCPIVQGHQVAHDASFHSPLFWTAAQPLGIPTPAKIPGAESQQRLFRTRKVCEALLPVPCGLIQLLKNIDDTIPEADCAVHRKIPISYFHKLTENGH